MKICHCDWFNKEADWSIDEEGKVRQKSQTENDGKKKGGVREKVTRRFRGSKTYWRTGKAMSHIAIYRLVEMG